MIHPSAEELAVALDGRRNGRGWRCRWPAHDDAHPSLDITQGDDGKTLFTCRAGCPQGAVLAALRDRGLWPPTATDPRPASRRPPGKPGNGQTWPTPEAYARTLPGEHAGTWYYTDAQGKPVLSVIRVDGPDAKTFRPLRPVPGGWAVGDPPGPLPLYRLGDILAAPRDGTVYVLEGEKAADAGWSIGLTATTSAHGAKAASKTDWRPLAGRECVLLPDADPAGEAYARDVAEILSKLDPSATVRIADLRKLWPDLPEGGDLADYVAFRDSVEPDDLRRGIEQLADATSFVTTLKQVGLSRNESRCFPLPIPASELGSGEAVAWLWDGYLAVGFVTLLTGLWKSGKTTLLAHLIQAMGQGSDLAGRVEAGRVLVVAEEGAGLWGRRRDDLGIGDHASFIIRPFKGRPAQEQWEAFVDYLAELVRTGGYKAVVFDTLPSMSPISDENDAARMLAVLTPLHRITEAGAAVLLIHHPRKSDAAEGQAARGSGALPGFVDIIIELRRFDRERRDDRRRTLTAYSRFDETPGEVVVELSDAGYRLVGSRADAKQADRLSVLADILPNGPPGLTPQEVRAAWPEEPGIPRPSERTIRRDLAAGSESGRWSTAGGGVRGSPERFYRPENNIRDSSSSICQESSLPPDALPGGLRWAVEDSHTLAVKQWQAAHGDEP